MLINVMLIKKHVLNVTFKGVKSFGKNIYAEDHVSVTDGALVLLKQPINNERMTGSSIYKSQTPLEKLISTKLHFTGMI